MSKIQESQGLVPFGWAAHATNITLRALTKLFQSTVIDLMGLISKTMRPEQVSGNAATVLIDEEMAADQEQMVGDPAKPCT